VVGLKNVKSIKGKDLNTLIGIGIGAADMKSDVSEAVETIKK
jgi:hypothetical protein